MKKTIKLIGIIAIIMVIGFSMTACDLLDDEEEETISLQGKWQTTSTWFYEFTGENFMARNVAWRARGTFTYTDTHITFYPTHYWASGGIGVADDWVEWNTTTVNSATQDLVFHGNPVPYWIEKTPRVQLYIGSKSNLPFNKQGT